MADVRSWQQAWETTLTGANSFYRGHPPLEHFSTSISLGHELARHLCEIIENLDDGSPLIVTDVGAGGGQLITYLAEHLHSRPWIHLQAIDIRPPPVGLSPTISWLVADARTVNLSPAKRVLIAHEMLDDIPCERFEVDEFGIAHLIVVSEGEIMMGPRLTDDAGCAALDVDAFPLRQWLHHWWPPDRPFMRGEIGLTRDTTWRHLTAGITDGLAIAVDYGHLRQERIAGTWDGGTLIGFAHGRARSAQLDGSCNLTAHVAFDSLATGVPRGDITVRRQSQILHNQRLTKPGGLGDLLWLTQTFTPT